MSRLPRSTPAHALTRAFANLLRGRLLFEYERETTSPSRLAVRLGERLNLVSYHTNVLVALGCVERVRTVSRRGVTERFYRAVIPWELADEVWDELPVATRRALTNAHLASATAEAHAAAWAGGFDDPRTHLTRMMLELDPAAEAQVARLLRGVVHEIAAVEAASRRRGNGAIPHELVVLQFRRPEVGPPRTREGPAGAGPSGAAA